MAAEQTQQQAQFDKMTKTPIPRLVLGLAVPTILSMLITSIYNLADTFFVGQISTSASGAVGVVSSLMAVIQAIGFMLGPTRPRPPALPPPAFSRRSGPARRWACSVLPG